jgi:hypothetical protein
MGRQAGRGGGIRWSTSGRRFGWCSLDRGFGGGEGSWHRGQTLANWVKADKGAQLRGVLSEQVSAERMEVHRLRWSMPAGATPTLSPAIR